MCMPEMVPLVIFFEYESRRLSVAIVIELIDQILRNVIAIEECSSNMSALVTHELCTL